MKGMRWFAVMNYLLLIVACFLPWISVESRGIVVTGMRAEAINFGKPALLHFVFTGFVLLALLVGRSWSYVTAFFMAAFNFMWALRNYVALSRCSGECPSRLTGIYALLLLSITGIIAILLIGQGRRSSSPRMAKP